MREAMGEEAIAVAIPLERCMPTAYPAARLDGGLASIEMLTAHTACVDELVYMRWQEAGAAEWANIHRIKHPPTDPRPLARTPPTVPHTVCHSSTLRVS